MNRMHRILAVVLVLLAGFAWYILRDLRGMIDRNSEGNSIGRLSGIRSALSIYYGDMEGFYPTDLSALTAPHVGRDGNVVTYLESLEAAQCRSPYHPTPDCSRNREPGIHDQITYSTAPTDAGGWGYNNDPGHPNFGSIWVNCTHTDINGRSYSAY
ncbi:MAG: hypothetical protein HY926_07640 [Elusimicrobia bacterium]|nr:hypothetical protein [Elusimicrobiota bacterium]